MGLIKKIFSVGAVALMSLGITVGVFADITEQNNVDVSILSGGLHLDTGGIESFGNIIIEPYPTTYYTSYEGELIISDLRGSKEGWLLQVEALPFQNSLTGNELPVGSLTLKRVETVEFKGTGNESRIKRIKPDILLQDLTIIDDGYVDLVKADEGYGLGVWGVQFPTKAFGLNVNPTTIESGDYNTLVVWSLTAAPPITSY